jgi:Zn ribbon nucleic-acid-binding protein
MRKRKTDITVNDNLKPTFRHRNVKKTVSDTRSTLKLKHKEKMEEFEKEKASVTEKKNEITELKKKLGMLEGVKEKDSDIFTEIHCIYDRIETLETEISDIKNDKSEIEYLLSTSELFKDYFEKNTNKKQIYNSYLKKTNDITAEYNQEEIDELIDTVCKLCNTEKSFVYDEVEDLVSCVECGYSKKSNFHKKVGNMGFKEIQDYDIQTQFAYQRISHFNEQLENLQGMQQIEIPEKYITAIKEQIKKENYDIYKINDQKMRFYLKKLNLNRYYEHSHRIIEIVTGKKAPKMEDELIETLRTMFTAIQAPYDKHKPDDRKSFLNYRYVLYKFCELLTKDEYLPYFPLLKSTKKLEEHDKIWKKICKDLRWEFYPTENSKF